MGSEKFYNEVALRLTLCDGKRAFLLRTTWLWLQEIKCLAEDIYLAAFLTYLNYVRQQTAWLVLVFLLHGDARSRNFFMSGSIFQPTTLC